MNPNLTIALLAAAGVALVVQNLLMVRITETVSTVIITLVISSSMGLALLLAVLLLRNRTTGLTEAIGTVRPWDQRKICA
jgi:transporter family-2 protein